MRNTRSVVIVLAVILSGIAVSTLTADTPSAVGILKDAGISGGKGRIFYTSLGHAHETIADQRYLKHLLAGIQYTLGDLSAPAPVVNQPT